MENGGISYPLEQPLIATTSLDGSEDCDQSQPVLAGALQRWGERHKNKVSTLTASDISCLHQVELDGAPLVPDESVKKRLRPLPTQKQSKKMAAERRSRVAKGSMSTSSRESGDVIAGAGDALEETKVCCEEIVDQERKRESACDGEVEVGVSGGRCVAGAQARRESREKRRRGVLGGLLKMNISESLAGLSRNMLVRRRTSADRGVIPTGTFVQGEGPFEGPLTTDMLKQVRACFSPTKRDCVRVHGLADHVLSTVSAVCFSFFVLVKTSAAARLCRVLSRTIVRFVRSNHGYIARFHDFTCPLHRLNSLTGASRRRVVFKDVNCMFCKKDHQSHAIDRSFRWLFAGSSAKRDIRVSGLSGSSIKFSALWQCYVHGNSIRTVQTTSHLTSMSTDKRDFTERVTFPEFSFVITFSKEFRSFPR